MGCAPCAMAKLSGTGFGALGLSEPVRDIGTFAAGSLMFNIPGLVLGTVAALYGYPKVAVGLLVVNDVAVVAFANAWDRVDGDVKVSAYVTNFVVIGAAATGLYFLGRYRDRKRSR